MRVSIRRAGQAWAAVLALLLVWLVVAGVSGAASNRSYESELREAQARASFYLVVAGERSPRVGQVEDKLGGHLNQIPADRLGDFQGDSNRYGGITEALGVDPFTGECGTECGHLTPDFQEKIEIVKAGGADAVIEGERPEQEGGLSSSVPLILIVLWLATGVAAYLLLMVRIRAARVGQQQSLREAYPDECREIDRLDAVMKALPPGGRQYDELQRLRDGIEMGLRRRLDPSVVDDHLSEARLERLMVEAGKTLRAVEEGNRVLDR